MSMTHDLPTDYQKYIHLSRYARWVDSENRRETWPETVKRYCDFFAKKFGDVFPYERIYNAIYNLEVMPSMRALMTAGPALERDNVPAYNCSFIAIDNPKAFDEILYILMCGTGVGFSVERQYIVNLPQVPEELHPTDTVVKVKDSRIGWAAALREVISLLYAGHIPGWDTSAVRPAGARLKTFGGRASGPEPLEQLFRNIIAIFKKAKGRRLTSLECHDIVCYVADAVIVGGVRRSALISLSNLSDDRMRVAKSGNWWDNDPQRMLANNSAVYTERPEMDIFMKEWLSLVESKSGERGIISRAAMQSKAASLGERRDASLVVGTNPCGEITLRNHGFCNLTEIVARPNDTKKSLDKKTETGIILGTFQAALTDFKYLRSSWRRNAEEEALLGVSITGIRDCPLLNDKEKTPQLLKELSTKHIETNKYWANLIGIKPSAAIYTVKPSGTVSQLVNASSGIHERFSQYYIRTVRNDKKDPLSQFLIDQGIPYEADLFKPESIYVFSFPVKAPEGSLVRDGETAIDQLERYLMFYENWAEHNVSITVYVKDHEWLEVGAWVYKNFNKIGGISFLPFSDHVYKQAPYTAISEEEYNAMQASMPTIDWSLLSNYEKDDSTVVTKELACTAGACEIL